ncbi:hypothetical protein TNIN_167571 [Trichonephila inaurata madagascariensis]|uniref:Uncharacterized protein n=1 Tax=Trichonephila inaurata madagascariensis TaxID=2747483 RepID=A0A8X7CIN2_9ARAC|nr:hypothetical protein TNIN_167571 [Trichonephila inaurata madagascariensis]
MIVLVSSSENNEHRFHPFMKGPNSFKGLNAPHKPLHLQPSPTSEVKLSLFENDFNLHTRNKTKPQTPAVCCHITEP